MPQKKVNIIMMMVALCLSGFAIMGDMVLVPIASFLYETFENTGAVSYIIAGPALILAVVSAIGGGIVEKIGARKFLIIGFGVYTVGCALTAFSQALPVLIICRTLQGVGGGALMVCAYVIIAEHFSDESKRGTMNGIFTGFTALIGAILSTVSGILSASNWHNAFYLYLAPIIIYIILIIFIPADTAPSAGAQEENQETSSASKKTPMPWGIVARVAIGMFFFTMAYCVVGYQIAVIMADKGIVDTTMIGIMSSLGTVGSFIASASFGVYFKRLKRFTPTMGYLVLAIFFTLLYLSTSTVAACVSCFFLGACYGLGVSYYVTYASMIVPPERIPTSTAMTTFGMGMGTFLASYIPYGVMAAMGTESIVATLPVLIGALVIALILSVIFGLKEKSYFKNM